MSAMLAALALLLSGRTVAAVPTATPASNMPSMDAITVVTGGARMNGLIYVAAGAGPHPVALFLHGFPGNEKNLDLAQAARSAGWDGVYVDYRGSWGSGGTFSFANSLEDAAGWLAWIHDPVHAAKYRYDPARIAVVGHSFGGWLALLSARREPASVCVAALAAWNVGWLSQHLEESGLLEDALKDFRDATDPAGGPLHTTADALRKELTAAPDDWNYLSAADALKSRPLLLLSATRDTPDEDPAMHRSLERAIRGAGGGSLVKSVTLDDDHGFSASRAKLAELLVQWLDGDCERSARSSR